MQMMCMKEMKKDLQRGPPLRGSRGDPSAQPCPVFKNTGDGSVRKKEKRNLQRPERQTASCLHAS